MTNRVLGRLELVFRNAVAYPLLRLLFRNERVALPLDIRSIASVVVLRYDKIGDMIVTLPIFEMLKRRNPQLKIGVVTSESNLEIVKDHSCVDECFVLYRNPLRLLRELWRLRNSRYEVVLNFIFNRTTSGGIIANLACPHAVKIGQGAEKYGFYFNAMLELPRSSVHMLDILAFYIEQVFGFRVGATERRLRMEIVDITRNRVDDYLANYALHRRDRKAGKRRRYYVLNISAREANKRISPSQGLLVARGLLGRKDAAVVVISAPEDTGTRKEVVRSLGSLRCHAFPDSGQATMHEIASLVEGAVGVVSPDTSIIHVASATRTPVLGFFTPLQVNQEWLPYKTKHTFVLAPDGRSVSEISPEALRKAVDGFIGRRFQEARHQKDSKR